MTELVIVRLETILADCNSPKLRSLVRNMDQCFDFLLEVVGAANAGLEPGIKTLRPHWKLGKRRYNL